MKIFISYGSTDRHAVSELVSDLQDLGHEVWYDRELEGGQKWWDNVLANICHAEALIFALTPKSLASYPCRLEYTYANALKKHIIPLVLTEGMDFTLLPPVLQERQILSYVDGDKAEYKALTQALRSLPPPAAAPDPLPEPPPVPISPLAPLKTQIDAPTLAYEQQVAILHQLKGYVRDPNYANTARELLERLDKHPTLLASVHRDIQDILGVVPPLAPPPDPSPDPSPDPPPDPSPDVVSPGAQATTETATPDVQGTDPSTWLHEGEHIVDQKVVNVNAGLIWGTQTLFVTNQRLLFSPRGLATLYSERTEIALPDIIEIRKVVKMLNPAILIRVKGPREYYLSVGKTGLGNRDKLITLIQQYLR